jgi:GH15 family glucan-1,4-alpha-glucosidase
VGEITDFMPVKASRVVDHQHNIVRSVAVVRGSLSFEMVCRPAFNFARDPHKIHIMEHGVAFESQSLCLGLYSSIQMHEDEQGGVRATFTLNAGESVHFVLESARHADLVPHLPSDGEYREAFQKTLTYWRRWIAQCQYSGRWREMVHRSALVLKLLTYSPTGAIVAAPTTSLPETIGGPRNWDYRFTWLRDASFTLYSLLILGFSQEAEAFMSWLVARCHELKATAHCNQCIPLMGNTT